MRPERSPYLPDLRERGVPVYHSLRSFYKEHHADLAVIATPIHFHTVHALEALTNGSHVLCEKPLSAMENDFPLWEKAVREAQRWAAIGFNWSFSKTVHALKRDRMAGMFGRAKSLKTLVFGRETPRTTNVPIGQENASPSKGRRFLIALPTMPQPIFFIICCMC